MKTPLHDLFDQFIREKRLQALSEYTIDSYKNILGIFFEYIGTDLAIGDLTRSKVDDYIFSLMERNLAKATVSTYVRNVRIFLTWIYNNHEMGFDPRKIKVPKSPKKKVQVLSDEEIVRVFEKAATSVPWITARNRVIIALMLDSGVRQGEICGLQKNHFNTEKMIFKVTGKGAKERFVPLGQLSKDLLEQYYALCPFSSSEHVFVDRLGRPLSRNAIRVFMNRLKHQTGLDISSHKFRHNFATNYCLDNLQSTGNSNVYDLSILMGHESIETTKRYEHFAHELIAAKSHCSHLDALYQKIKYV